MTYLICDKCNGYYELQPGESPEDFDYCQCGGALLYADEIDYFIETPKKTTKKRKIPQNFGKEEKQVDKRIGYLFLGSCVIIWLGISTMLINYFIAKPAFFEKVMIQVIPIIIFVVLAILRGPYDPNDFLH